MHALAVVLEAPEQLTLRRVELTPPGDDDVVVDIAFSGISTGTERLLYNGRMPKFPGMGYPLVPGYESVGRVSSAGSTSGRSVGQWVFVPGARCFGDLRGLFGGAASRLVVPGAKATPVAEHLGESSALFALAATAHHAIALQGVRPPDLIVGHGVLGRFLARITIALGHAAPVVWEKNPGRQSGAEGYSVLDPELDSRRDYKSIYDVSGDSAILDSLIARLAPGGEIVLAGFYTEMMSFAFAPAFMREVRILVAAEWRDSDLAAVIDLVACGRLSMAHLITHREAAANAKEAYARAFGDISCLKMVLDWSAIA